MSSIFQIKNKRLELINRNSSRFLVSRRIIEPYSPIIKEYIELEYIEGTGTQLLDFGFSPRSFDVCTTKIMPIEYTGHSYIGNMLTDNNDWRFFVANKTTAYFDAFETRIWGVDLQVNLNEACTFSFGYDSDTGRTFIENKDKSIKFTGSDTITSNKIAQGNLKAFQCDYYNSKSKFRLYSLKYNGEQNQLDLIPVKDKSNVVCMYDKVSRTFFYNQGSGEFVAGPEV